MNRRASVQDRRALAADLAIQAGCSVDSPGELMGTMKFLHAWIEHGEEAAERCLVPSPQSSADLHVIAGGKSE